MTQPDAERTSSSTLPGYFVEARTMAHEPEEVAGQRFTDKWKRVHFDEARVGVPIGRSFEAPIFRLAGCYGYAAAQALRWWFHAAASRGICLESRIVKCEIKHSIDVTRKSEHCVIGGEDRSNDMPDWGNGQ